LFKYVFGVEGAVVLVDLLVEVQVIGEVAVAAEEQETPLSF
jgi:hypothetical protein